MQLKKAIPFLISVLWVWSLFNINFSPNYEEQEIISASHDAYQFQDLQLNIDKYGFPALGERGEGDNTFTPRSYKWANINLFYFSRTSIEEILQNTSFYLFNISPYSPKLYIRYCKLLI